MCGICGVVGGAPERRAQVVSRMNAALTHRGPDGTGVGHFDIADIAMSRLAIIDVAGGAQPVECRGGYSAIVNGELYNFRELRRELEDAGHRFRSDADSEVVAHGFAEWREGLFAKLEGMFALAVYDRREQQVFLARDRFGEKPLFFYEGSSGFLAFSSELRSLLQHPDIPRRMDRAALGYYLRLGLFPEPMTPFDGVTSLPPGTFLSWKSARIKVRKFHTVDYHPDPRLNDDGLAEEAVEAALTQAVQRQAVSDVPLGAFLSGGVDSSTIVALLQRSTNRQVKTFTVRFEDAGYDESPIAQETARYLETDHTEISVPNTSFEPEHLWRIIDHTGLPFSDSSALPMFELSRRVREHVTVALSGDGGDELFAGYPFFQWGRTIGRVRRAPLGLLRASHRASDWASHQPMLQGVGILRKTRRVLDAAMVDQALMPATVHSLFEPPLIRRLIAATDIRNLALGSLDAVTVLPPQSRGWSPLRRLMYYRQVHNLPCDMLIKVDRMAMAASLEVRAPMLDVAVAEVASCLPDRQLLRGHLGKYVLRRIARKLVPERVLSTPKSGFSIPLHRYQNTAYKDFAEQVLVSERHLDGVLDRRVVENILALGLSTDHDSAGITVYKATHQLWALVMLAAWVRRFRVSL